MLSERTMIMPVSPQSIVIDLSRDALFDEVSMDTIKDRYLVGDEKSPQHAFARASAAFASDESHAQRLYDYASRHWFGFATPLLSNGGTNRGLPISCFLSFVPDSRQGILDNYTENGWLASMGGGIGSYWGALRSKGTSTSKGSRTSGVVPFVKVVDSQMLAFNQGGTRRGVAAVYLDISHPEIEEWLVMRKPTGGDANRKALNLNNAVCVPDAFMHAVKDDLPWDLIDPHTKTVTKTLPARELWKKIIELRFETGEPYLFFVDTANRALPQPLKDIGLRIYGSNLCSEIMLPTGPDPRDGLMRTAVCCLSSVNLARYDEWRHDPLFIGDLMEMLDNCLQSYIDTAPESHAAAVRSAQRERSVGLGAMGFHTYLQTHGIAMESDLARAVNVMMFKHIRKHADEASQELAADRGAAPDMAPLAERFSHKMANAPNASSGIICGNVSPSTEPKPANAYLAKTLSGTHMIKNSPLIPVLEAYGKNTDEVWKSIVAHEGSVQHLEFLSERERSVFRTAPEIDQMYIVQLAADRQHYIDQGQSVNLFVPRDVTAQELHDMHFSAWKKGLKALYYLRNVALSRADLVGLSTERRSLELRQDDASDMLPIEALECLACEG